jgi:hypothetical protein
MEVVYTTTFHLSSNLQVARRGEPLTGPPAPERGGAGNGFTRGEAGGAGSMGARRASLAGACYARGLPIWYSRGGSAPMRCFTK